MTALRPARVWSRGVAVSALAAIGSLLLLGVPEAMGTASLPLNGTVTAGGTAWVKPFSVPQTGTITATINWSSPTAALTLAIVDSAGHQLAASPTTTSPETVSLPSEPPGTYKVRVKAKAGSSPTQIPFSGTVTYPGAPIPTFVGQIGLQAAGHATIYPSGLDVGPDGTLYVADTGNDQIAAYSSANPTQQLWRVGKRGVRSAGNFANPRDIAYLNGKLYVDDTGNNRVQVLNASNGSLASSATWGLGTSSLGITAGKDASGNDIILVAEDIMGRIAVFNTDGVHRCDITGPAGTLNGPRDAATDAQGNVYVADYGNNRIVRFGAVGSTCPSTVVSTWGVGGQAAGQFKRPYGVATDPAGHVYVADSDNERIQEFSPTPTGADLIAIYGSATSTGGDFFQLRRVAVANGQVYGADLWAFHIDRFPACSTTCLTPAAPVQTYPTQVQGPQDGSFNEPSGLTFDDDTGTLTVADAVNQRMQQFSPTADPGTWSFTRQFGQRGWGMSDQSGFNWPRDVTYEAGTQTLWVADTKNNRLLPFTATGDPLQGKLITLNASLKGMYWPYAVDAVNGDLIAADTFKNQLESRDPAAPAQPLWVTTTVNGVALKNPYDVAHHGSLLFIADSANKRIVELNADKTDPGVALGTACLHAPQGVAYDAVSGMLWVADTSFNRLEEIDPTTGACVQAVTKFNGADTFNHPGHLEVHQDAGGHSYLYVCDMYNDRVVILDLNEN